MLGSRRRGSSNDALGKAREPQHRMWRGFEDGGVDERRTSPVLANRGGKGRRPKREKKKEISVLDGRNTKSKEDMGRSRARTHGDAIENEMDSLRQRGACRQDFRRGEALLTAMKIGMALATKCSGAPMDGGKRRRRTRRSR